MKKKKIGEYFLYKYNDINNNETVIGRIIRKKIVNTGWKGNIVYEYEAIKDDKHKWFSSNKYFSDESEMYMKSIFGKNLDELWVRMI